MNSEQALRAYGLDHISSEEEPTGTLATRLNGCDRLDFLSIEKKAWDVDLHRGNMGGAMEVCSEFDNCSDIMGASDCLGDYGACKTYQVSDLRRLGHRDDGWDIDELKMACPLHEENRKLEWKAYEEATGERSIRDSCLRGNRYVVRNDDGGKFSEFCANPDNYVNCPSYKRTMEVWKTVEDSVAGRGDER